MIVLTTSTAEQTINFISRGAFDAMVLTDEQSNESTVVNIISQTNGDYVNTISAEFALVEAHFYTLTLLNGADIVYKGKIFCTDKDIVNFSVNEGKYKSNTTSNTFIVYE